MTEFTPETKQIINNGYSYRCDAISEFTLSKYPRGSEIIKNEIDGLANNDILDTLHVKNSKEAIAEAEKRLGKSFSTVWLCNNVSNVYRNYIDYMLDDPSQHKSDYPINKYKLPEHYIVLSDIGTEGTLIGFPANEELECITNSIEY